MCTICPKCRNILVISNSDRSGITHHKCLVCQWKWITQEEHNGDMRQLARL